MNYFKTTQLIKPSFEIWEKETLNSQELIKEYEQMKLKNRRLYDKIPNELKPYINFKISYKKYNDKIKILHPERYEQSKAKVRQIYRENENIREHKRNNYLLKKINPLSDEDICLLMENITNNFKELEIKEQLIKSIKGIKDIFKKE